MKVGVRIDGLKELDYALGNLGLQSQARIFRPAITAALRKLRRTIVQAAPRSKGQPVKGSGSEKYGHLYKNIKLRAAKIKNKVEVIGAITTGAGFWGYIIEKGSRYISPKPWFDPAFKRGEGEAMNTLRERVTVELPKEFDRLARWK